MNRIENLLWICLFVHLQFSYAQTSSSNHFNHDTAYLRRYGYAQLNQTLALFPKIKLDSTVSYDYWKSFYLPLIEQPWVLNIM